MTPTRRRLLATGSLAVLGGCSAISGGGGQSRNSNGNGTPTADPPQGPVANAPTPDSPGERTYATMGTGGPLVTYFGSWKCPACAEFSTGFLRDIVGKYVEPGEVRLRFLGLAYGPDGDPYLGPDAPRATRAGLAVWNVDPGSYWAYHEQVLANQPPENEQWATTDRLTDFAHVAGVDNVGKVRTAIEKERYGKAMQASADAAAEVGISGTPSLFVDGELVSPVDEKARTRELLDRAAQQTATPTGTPSGNESSG